MALRVLAFARLRELLGYGETTVEVGPAATLDEVWAQLTASLPEAARMRGSMRFACNGVVVDGATRVADGDEIALLPPVGGG